jgi:hypothetical protein
LEIRRWLLAFSCGQSEREKTKLKLLKNEIICKFIEKRAFELESVDNTR